MCSERTFINVEMNAMQNKFQNEDQRNVQTKTSKGHFQIHVYTWNSFIHMAWYMLSFMSVSMDSCLIFIHFEMMSHFSVTAFKSLSLMFYNFTRERQ